MDDRLTLTRKSRKICWKGKMSEPRPGIIQYTDSVKENMGGNIVNALFFKVLENRPISQQIHWYMKNIDNLNITYHLSEGKNEKLARKHREKGNGLFVNNEFPGALSLYNQSIAFGVKSENLSLCYANRSAVYFELGMFQKCLEDIERAKKLKFPAHLLAKLNKRAADANSGLQASKNVNLKFECFNQLSKPASKDRPFLVDCLEGSDLNDLANRRIRTKNALVAGDVISIETKPFSAVLRAKLIFSHCSYCLSTDAAMSLIPCKFCSTAMFCNEACYKRANDLFHKFECPIIDAIYGMLSDSMWLGLRTILMAIGICGSVEKFEKILTAINEKRENIFEQTFEQAPENAPVDLCDLDRFTAIMNLPVNEEFNLEDCAGTAFALKLLTENTKLIDRDDVRTVEFLAIAIYKSMNIARYNAVLLEETYSMIGLTNEITFYGRALFPFASNFNLSCAPNVLLLNHNKSMVGVVLRPIPSDGTVYAGLAALNHITGDLNYRQGLKKQHLGRNCECIACKRNYGRMENLRPDPNVKQPSLPKDMAVADLIGASDATLKQYNFLCAYLNKHSDLKYLTFQVAGAINQLIFTLGKMAHPAAIEMKLGESLGEKI